MLNRQPSPVLIQHLFIPPLSLFPLSPCCYNASCIRCSRPFHTQSPKPYSQMSLSHGIWQVRSPIPCPRRSSRCCVLDIECSCPSGSRSSRELSSPSPTFFLRVLIKRASRRFAQCSRRGPQQLCPRICS